DFLGRLAAAAARSATIPVIIVFATAGGIECREILADCMGCFLGLRPGNRLVAWNTLLLVDIRLDQARIDREGFAADQPGRNAIRHHTLEHPAQGIARAEALMPRPAEHRMIGDLVLDAELAK